MIYGRQHHLRVAAAAALAFCALTSSPGGHPLVAAQEYRSEDVDIVVLVPDDADSGYKPLVPALESAFRLGAEHVNEAGSLLQLGNVSLSIVGSAEGARAAGALCTIISANDTSTYAVIDALGSASGSLIGSLSNSYLHLPVFNVGGMSARSDSRDTVNGGYLLGVLPDILPQMTALVRLILDMKLARDAVDGRSETVEYVWLVHTSDSYGSTAAAAFGRVVSTYSVAMPNSSTSSSSDTSYSSSSSDPAQASVEISRTTVLSASALASFDAEMTTLAEDDATIIVLLTDGFEPSIIRNIFTQARSRGLTEGVQWYLPDVAAMDHIFDHNETYRDVQLANDLRGTLGLRACTPLTGPGSDVAAALTAEWQRLDTNEYEGAGVASLTADGTLDPLLAFAYDSVFVAAAAVQQAQEEVVFRSGTNLSAIDLDRCPFPENGAWSNGSVVRDSVFAVSSSLVGATGLLNMSVGDVADGRDVETVTFCAVNMRSHTTQGARFEMIRTLDGETLYDEDGPGFQIISQFQEEQTYPAGSTAYPYDRPLLNGRHLDVVMRRNAPPFVFVEGDGASNDDFTGITPEFLKSLSTELGFTYSLRAPPAGTATTETITMVRNGSADMTGSWITITAERSEYVSFTYPYYDLGISFVYKPAESDTVNLWKAFSPFEPTLWLTLLFALIGTVFLLWLYEGAKNDQFSHGNWGRRRRNVSVGLSRSVYVTASLMMAQLTHKPETLEGYLLTLGWLFASFVLAASYTAELASFLTATKTETTTLTVDGLKTGEIAHTNVALLQGGNTQYLYERDFMGCSDDECSLIAQPQPCFSTEECFYMVANGTAMTTLADSATAEYQLQTLFCDLDLLPDTLYPQHYGLVLPLDSALADEFTKTTLTLREDGTLSAQAEIYLDSSSQCVSITEAEADTSNMTVSDVSGVFLVLAAFVALSLCSWCARRSPAAKSMRARKQRKNPPPDETLTERFSKMSRRQQKSFALEATVRLLQESKGLSGLSSSSTSTLGTAETEEQRRHRQRRQAQKQEMAEGRPVVSLNSGDSEDDSRARVRSFGWNRLRSSRLVARTDRSSKSGPRLRKSGSGLDPNIGPMMSVHHEDMEESSDPSPRHQSGGKKKRGGLFNMFARDRMPSADDSDDGGQAEISSSVPVQSAASTWLARRNSSVPSPLRKRASGGVASMKTGPPPEQAQGTPQDKQAGVAGGSRYVSGSQDHRDIVSGGGQIRNSDEPHGAGCGGSSGATGGLAPARYPSTEATGEGDVEAQSAAHLGVATFQEPSVAESVVPPDTEPLRE